MKPELVSLSAIPPLDAGRQCLAFLCVRDEADRMVHLLSYYRKLGVHWFFVVDNGSTDGTVELLRAQPDCSVFTTTESYAQSHYGMDWINALLEAYGIGHWCLFVDADELLVYPHAEEVRLSSFCQYLEVQHYDGIYAFMLDMYSEGAIASADYAPGKSFLDVCPLFDPDYSFRTRPALPMRPAAFPPLEVVGGPRLRRFYPEFRDAGPLRYAIPRGLTKVKNSRVGRMLRAGQWLGATTSPPLLSKIPLMLGAPGRAWVSSHKTLPLRLAPVTGILLHFKFFSDFHRRVTKAIAEGQHFDGGSEYGRYAAALETDPELCLAHAGSLRYQSSEDLIQRGLLRTDPGYEAFGATLAASPQPAVRRHDALQTIVG
jgi:hypothetical protein